MMWCDDKLVFLLGCTQRAVRARLTERLVPLGVSYEQFQALLGLAVGDDIAQVELAGRLCLEPTYTARMLSRAEEQGLVTRERDVDDARVQRVQLTPKGQALWDKLNALHDQFRAEMLACLSEAEQEELRRLLIMLRDHATQLSQATCQA
jgi:DNA-binding MarR family transcriptional regulator